MILHIKETVIRVRKKHCDVRITMYYLKFTFKSPEYTRNIFFFNDYLADFPNIKKLSDFLPQTE